MRPTCGVHTVWHHLFLNFLLNSPKSCDLFCDYTIRLWLMWQHDQSTLTLVVLKIENRKIKQNKRKIKMKSKMDKTKSTICKLDIFAFLAKLGAVATIVCLPFQCLSLVSDSQSLFFSPTFSPMSIQICPMFILLFYTLERPFCLHKLSSYYSIHSSLEFFH